MKITKTLLALMALIGVTLCASAQVNQSTQPIVTTYYNSQPSPLSSVNNLWTNAGSLLSTNILNGWSQTSYTTNITTSWNSTTAAFVTTTNITTNTSTAYIQFPAVGQNFVPIEWNYYETVPSNAWIQVVRFVTGNYWSTDTNTLYLTNAASVASSTNTALFNIPMQGYNYGRIAAFGVVDSVNNHVFTHLGFNTSTKKN